MDSNLINLLNQKKSVIKALSVKDNQLSIDKPIQTTSDLDCGTLICNKIELNSFGEFTELSNLKITESMVNSTTIGNIKPSSGNFTNI